MRDWVFLFTFLRCFSARRLLTRFTCCKLRFLARVCSSPRYLRSFSRQNSPPLEHEMETSYSSTFSSSSSHSRSSSYEASRKMRATSEVWNGQSWGILYIWLFSGLRQVLRLHENWPEETPARILHSRTNLHHRQLLPAVGSPLLPPPVTDLFTDTEPPGPPRPAAATSPISPGRSTSTTSPADTASPSIVESWAGRESVIHVLLQIYHSQKTLKLPQTYKLHQKSNGFTLLPSEPRLTGLMNSWPGASATSPHGYQYLVLKVKTL